ncbi:MAG: glycosyltransferase family 4 protein [Victivallales bacterium]|nr:glycosyltransferase family 4 protein [Victivallales bacterium]
MEGRILFIHHSSAMGGAERSLFDLVSCFSDKSGLACVVPPGPLADMLAGLGVRVHELPLRSLRRVDVFTTALPLLFYATCGLSRIIREEHAVLVHANSFTGAVFAAPAARLCRIAFSWHERDLARHGLLAPMIARFATFVACISDAVRENLCSQLPGRLHSRIRLVHNGIDFGKYSSISGRPRCFQGVPEKRRVVLMASQFVRWKGLLDFVDIAAQVKTRMPDTFFVIAGDTGHAGQQKHVLEVRSKIAAAGLENDFLLAGHVDDMASLLGWADCLTMLSRNEPFGRVMLEAMAAGTPVVAYDCGAAGEILENAVSGMLVEPGNTVQAAEQVCALLENSILRDEIAENASSRVSQKFSIERVYAEFTNILKEFGFQ